MSIQQSLLEIMFFRVKRLQRDQRFRDEEPYSEGCRVALIRLNNKGKQDGGSISYAMTACARCLQSPLLEGVQQPEA